MLADINIKLAAHDAKLTMLAPHLPRPSDQESAEKEALAQPWRRPTMGKLHIADNTVVMVITWSDEVIFAYEGKPAVHEDLSVMSFYSRLSDCDGY